MLAPDLAGQQTLPGALVDTSPLTLAASEIGLSATQGLELDQNLMEFIQSLIVGGDDILTRFE